VTPAPVARTLRVRPESLAICRLAADALFPAWVMHGEARFFSITHTEHETSIVCPEHDVPQSVERAESAGGHFRWKARCRSIPSAFSRL
jgi:hypothetical protein